MQTIRFQTARGTAITVTTDLQVTVGQNSLMRPELVNHETHGWCIAGGMKSLARDTFVPIPDEMLAQVRETFAAHAAKIEASLAADDAFEASRASVRRVMGF